MGSEKKQESGTTIVQQSTVPTPTAAELENQALDLAQRKAIEPGQTQMYQNAFNLGNQLLTSFGDKSGSMWQSLIGGVTPAMMNSQANQAVNVSNAALNRAGIMDSGVGQVATARAAADSYNQNSQYNVGVLQNALNLAMSGQAQIQSPALAQSGQLASQLAGLRSVSSTSNTNASMTSMSGANPFLRAGATGIGAIGGFAATGGNPYGALYGGALGGSLFR